MNRLPIFAGVDSTGAMKFVGDVPRGALCGCRCVACGAALIAKRGEINEWHFAHEASQERPDCFAGAINLLRRLAVELLKERKRFATPVYLRRVSTDPPLPIYQETIQWEPGEATVVAWELEPTQRAPVARLLLRSKTLVRLFVDADNSRGTNLVSFASSEAGLLYDVPVPTSTQPLQNLATAKAYVAGSGIFRWLQLPDANGKAAEVKQRLVESANARMREVAEVSYPRLVGDWQPPLPPAPVLTAASKPPPHDGSPWSTWRKPNSAVSAR